MSSETHESSNPSTTQPYVKPLTNEQPPDRLDITYNNVQLVDIASIHRPVFPELDYCKVDSLMETIENNYDAVPPLEALQSPSGRLYVFGGCHRFEAHKRLGRDKIKVNIRQATPLMLQLYLGASYQIQEDEFKKQQQGLQSEVKQ